MSLPAGRSARSPWFPYRAEADLPRLRLVCFPWAGGAASVFRPWLTALPAWIDVVPVQYPGRETRWGEPHPESLQALAASAIEALEALPPLPVALFGHSMGALVAFEAARVLVARARLPLAHLFVSGSAGPEVRDPVFDAWTYEGPALMKTLQDLRGLPPEALAFPELLELLLPVVRGDLRLLGTYAHAPGAPLPCPVTALGGTDDPLVPVAALEGWGAYASSPLTVEVLEGDHFYFRADPQPLLARLGATLDRAVGRAGSGAPGGPGEVDPLARAMS